MLYYEVKGEGHPLVLLHGYLENLKMWQSITAELSKFYKVIAIDLPGHGKSKVYGEVHTMELIAEKVNEVFVELQIKKAVIVGHSMGGYSALAFAELFPEKLKGMILLNSTSLPDSEEKKEQRLKAIEAARKNLDTMIKVSIPSLFAQKNLENLKEEVKFAKQLAKETPLEGVTAALKGMRLRPDRTNILRKFDNPIGVVIGKYDQAVNPKDLKRIIPEKSNILVTEIETGHMAHLEAPNLTYDFIYDFMSRIWDI